MITRRTACITLAAAAGALLTGCTAGEDPQSTPTTASPTELEGERIEPDPTDKTEDGGPVPDAANAEDEEEAIAAARATMDVWVQGSTLTQMEWQEQLAATLTPPAQSTYANRRGYKIKDASITGNPSITRSNATSAVVVISTDVATYEVTVAKAQGEWKTSAVTPLTGGDQ